MKTSTIEAIVDRARKRSSAQMAIDEGAPPVFDGTDQMVDRRRLSYEELPASCPLMARNPTRPHDYQATAGTALFNSARSTASGRCSTTWNGWATSISGELRPPVTGVEEGHSGSGGPDSFVEFVTTHVLRYTILPLSLLFPSRQPPIMPFVALAAQLFANKSSTSLLGSPHRDSPLVEQRLAPASAETQRCFPHPWARSRRPKLYCRHPLRPVDQKQYRSGLTP